MAGRGIWREGDPAACEDALRRSAMIEVAIWLIMERWRTPSAFRSCLSCNETLGLIRPQRDLVI
jgi:hypothetical protein